MYTPPNRHRWTEVSHRKNEEVKKQREKEQRECKAILPIAVSVPLETPASLSFIPIVMFYQHSSPVA